MGDRRDDADDDNALGTKLPPTERTGPDGQGVITIIEYKPNPGKGGPVKITKKIREKTVMKKISPGMLERKSLTPFFADKTARDDVTSYTAMDEETKIEPRMKVKKEDEFSVDPLKKANVWSKFRAAMPDVKEEEEKDAGPDLGPGATTGKYVPPSLRRAGGGAGPSLDDLRMQEQRDRDALTLRVTNLSEDVREGDLQELFGQFGRLQRIFLGMNPETKTSKGFAFITFSNQQDADTAMKRLDGHGYDNLVLRVGWSKPQNRDPPPAFTGAGDRSAFPGLRGR